MPQVQLTITIKALAQQEAEGLNKHIAEFLRSSTLSEALAGTYVFGEIRPDQLSAVSEVQPDGYPLAEMAKVR